MHLLTQAEWEKVLRYFEKKQETAQAEASPNAPQRKAPMPVQRAVMGAGAFGMETP